MQLKVTKLSEDAFEIRTSKDGGGQAANISKVCLELGGAVKVKLDVSLDDMTKGQQVVLEV